MQQLTIRNSPSGPPVLLNIPTTTDDLLNVSTVNGGTGNLTQALDQLNFNGGLIVHEHIIVTEITGGVQQINDGAAQPVQDGATPFFTGFTNPDPNLYYEAAAEFDVLYYGGVLFASVVLEFFLESSNDNGATWGSAIGAFVQVFATANEDSSRHCKIQLPPTAGSTLGVMAGDPTLLFRLSAKRSAPAAADLLWIESHADTGAVPGGTLTLRASERRSA